MRTWFITSTTYGTWLPGDERGFVSNTPDDDDDWRLLNVPQTEFAAADAERHLLSVALLKCQPINFTSAQADAIAAQFHETSIRRAWKLHTLAVMANHFHVVISAEEAVESAAILRDLKSYASRRLNQQWPKPTSETWWTESGSRRPVKDEAHFVNVVRHVADQPLKLAYWIDPALQHLLDNRPERKH